MKKLLPLLALSTLLFTGCSTNPKTPLDPHADPANLYAFQAATSIGVVGQAVQAVGPQAMMALDKESDPLADKIMSYLPAVEAALTGTDSITSAKEETGQFEGGYTLKMEISYKDIAFKDTSFTMLYNETPIVDDEQDDDEDDEQEIETQINGVIKMGQATYEMHGSRTKEVDEMEVEFTYSIDEHTTVTVEQEIEAGEQEFEYSIVRDGLEILEYSISFEGDEIELEIEQAGQVENEVEFELVNRDNTQLIKAEVQENDKVVATYFFKKVVLEDGTTSYELLK